MSARRHVVGCQVFEGILGRVKGNKLLVGVSKMSTHLSKNKRTLLYIQVCVYTLTHSYRYKNLRGLIPGGDDTSSLLIYGKELVQNTLKREYVGLLFYPGVE